MEISLTKQTRQDFEAGLSSSRALVNGPVKACLNKKRCVKAFLRMPYTAPESSASSTSPLCSPTPPGSSKNPHVRLHHKAHVNFLASHLPRRTGSDQGHVQCYCDKLIVINRFVIDLNPFQRWHHIQKGIIISAYLLSLAVTKV